MNEFMTALNRLMKRAVIRMLQNHMALVLLSAVCLVAFMCPILSAGVDIKPLATNEKQSSTVDPGDEAEKAKKTKAFLGEKVSTILSRLDKAEVYRIDESLSGVGLEARLMERKFLVAKSAMGLHKRIAELEQAGQEKNSDEIQRLQQEKERLVAQGKTQLAELKKEMEKNRVEEVRKKCKSQEFDEFLCRNDGKVAGIPILTQGPSLSREQMEEIRLILTDPRTYNFEESKLCTFEPGVAFLIHRESEVMTLLICFKCDELAISIGEGGAATEDFDFARPRLVTLVQQLLPNDPAIQGLALSRNK